MVLLPKQLPRRVRDDLPSLAACPAYLPGQCLQHVPRGACGCSDCGALLHIAVLTAYRMSPSTGGIVTVVGLFNAGYLSIDTGKGVVRSSRW